MKIVAHQVEHKGRKFELSLNFDEASMVDGHYKISAAAESWAVDDPKNRQAIVADVAIFQDDDQTPTFEVTFSGSVPGMEGKVSVLRKPLADLIDAEQIIDAIPAWVFTGDPVLGCMVRSGLSAIIGQTIQCKKSTADSHWYWERMKALGRCMLHHVPEMTGTAALRAAKCVFRFGF